MKNYAPTLSGRYRVFIYNSDGSLSKRYDYKPNLMLDAGLDMVASNLFCDCWRYCNLGTGTSPTVVDSEDITATQAGNTVTASAAIFSAQDVGRLLVFDSGEQAYITSYSSSTQVDVSVSRTIGSGTEFAIWRVNQTNLDTYVQHSTTYTGGQAFNGTTTSGGGIKFAMKRTWSFPLEESDITYYEIGFHQDNTADADLFSRVFDENGYTVAAEQRIQVTYEVTVNFGDLSRPSQNLAITGWPIAPAADTDAIVGFIKIPISIVDTDGTTDYNAGGSTTHCIAEPSNSNATIHIDTSTDFPVFGTNPSVSQGNYTPTIESYTAGDFSLIKTWEIPTFVVGTNFRRLLHITNTLGNDDVGWMAIFNDTQTKYDTHSLKISLQWTWNRILAANP